MAFPFILQVTIALSASGGTGFDQGTLDAVRDLAQSCLAASASTQQQIADVVARAALADACERELHAMAVGGFDRGNPTSTLTTLDDVQQLADLDAAVQRALNPPPPPPLSDCAESDPSNYLFTVDGSGQTAAQSDYAILEGQGSSVEATTEAQNMVVGPCSRSSDEDDASSVPDPSSAESIDASIEMNPEEVQDLLEGFPRRRTLLLFRIEKRRILMRCAQELQPQ